MKRIKKWLKEPLLHFLMLGGFIFLVYSLVDQKNPEENQIIIDDDKLSHISALWELQWKRKPDSQEMQSLVEGYIHQEILYREALRLNLDHNDEIVKRRLSQKMEFMASDITKLIEPATEENLKAYFETNKEKYRIPASFSFHQIYFSSKNHDDPAAFARQLLAKNDKESLESFRNKGDKILIEESYSEASMQDIVRNLGVEFYTSLQKQKLNEWTGPIQSGFGTHLVHISAKNSSFIPELAEIKNKVLRDYEYDTELKNKETIYKEIRKNYEVIIKSEALDKDQKNELYAVIN